MKPKPRVSVVMPAYNAEKFIKAAIESILTQTFTDFELLILDDGSRDNTAAIVQGYSDNRIKLIQKDNEGVAVTLNRGIELARGEFIWRHDADDVSLPTKLEQEINFMESHPDCILIATQVAFMTENSKVAWNKRQPRDCWFGSEPFKWVDFADFAPFSPITHGTALIRKTAFSIAGMYRTAFITSEDIDMWLRMLQHGKLAVLNECLSLHRISSASATAVHGWKNSFYRELAKTYYVQRQNGQPDDLEVQGRIAEPAPPLPNTIIATRLGLRYRNDLLDFHFAVHLDAGDWRECIRIAWLALRDGWRLPRLYKRLFILLFPEKLINLAVRVKHRVT